MSVVQPYYRVCVRLCLLVAILSISIHSSAQDTDPFSYNANIRPSAQAWEMTKYGNLTPSLYTGAFQYSLPIYTYKDPGFEVPISLDYRFCGYRPDEHSGFVGMGWNLNCGGAITREIVGLPDDYNYQDVYGFYYLAFSSQATSLRNLILDEDFHYLSPEGYGHYYGYLSPVLPSGNDIEYYFGQSAVLTTNPISTIDEDWGLNVGALYDQSSDVYHFKMPGYSGDFIISADGDVKLFNTSCPEGEIKVTLNFYGGMNGNSTVLIETGNGYKYYFGESRYYSDYTETILSPAEDQNIAKYCFSALKLRRIEAPNGRHLDFVCNKNNTFIHFKDWQYVDPGRTVSATDSIPDYIYSANDKNITSIKQINSFLLQEIAVDGTTIASFNYSDIDNREYNIYSFSSAFRSAYPGFFNHATYPNNKRLASINIHDNSSAVVEEVLLSASYTANDVIGCSCKMFLSSLSINNEVYSFEYNHAANTDQYPPIDCDATDHWGFWRYTQGKYQFHDSLDIHSQDASLYSTIDGHKNPVFGYAMYGALTRILYPTGGCSTVYYEPNYVNKRVDVNLLTTGERTIIPLTEPMEVGGVRVSKICNESSPFGFFRDSVVFQYDNGILSYMPRYIMSLNSYVRRHQQRPVHRDDSTYKYGISWCNKGLTYSKRQGYLGYSSVSIYHPDGSKTVYDFIDYEDYSDRFLGPDHSGYYKKQFSTCTDAGDYEIVYQYYLCPCNGDDFRNPVLTNYMLDDYSFLRGLVKAVTQKDLSGNTIEKIQYSYLPNMITSSRGLYSCFNHFVEDSTNIFTARLDSVTTTDYRSGSPITTTTSYTYNAKGQRVSEQTTSNTLADGYGRRYRYWHEIDSTAPAGNICDVASSRLRGNVEYITSLDHFAYNDTLRTLPVRKTSYNILTPYPTQTPFTPQTGDSTVVTMSYDSDNHWRPWTISYPDDAYVKYGWDATGRYVLSREENGLANKTYYQWQDMVGLSHITYPTGQGEYYGYDSHNRLCSIDNTWQEPLARYDYHLVNGGDTLTGGTNFIRRTSYLRPAISYKDISYYDGLGYPVQDVALNAGSAGHVVTPKWLDPMRREDARLYLPYPSDVYTFDASAISSQQNWYQNRFGSGETYNYQENRYESSPVGKKISSRLPGEAYRSHPDTTVYRVNSALDSVLALSYNAGASSTISVGAAYAPAGTLACTITTDADGHITEEYSDAFGHVLLSRSRGDGDKADTYYVRDMKDSLVCVIQPEGSAAISRGMSMSLSQSSLSDILGDYAFIYTYDARGRLVSKKGPSLESEEFVYDDRNRLVRSSDGNLRDEGRQIKYEYDDYDCLTRKSIINASTGATVVVLAEYAYDRTGYQCTGTNAPPVPSALAFAVVDPEITGVYAPATIDRAGTSLGQKYYEKQLILEGGRYTYGNPKYVERAFYYDNLGRLLQSVESNAQGGITRESFNYDFVGNPVSRHISATAGNTTVTKLTAFDNDTRGRVNTEYSYLNGATTPTTSVIFTYDVLGRQNAINDGGLVQADHYALQGWVSQRGSELTVGGVTSDIFSEYLRRESAVYTTPSYTGRIAETFWMHDGQPSGTYSLTYDGFGRLRDGWHYLYGNPTNAWSERNITYDRNGNVLSLLRYGSSGTTPTNNYTFSYEGNRASMLNNTDYFEYDFNGNVTGDAARGMAIGYNLLNLPSWLNDGQSDLCVFYDYLADGAKVALHREETGLGLAWLGDIVFNLEEDARAPEDPGDGSRGVGSRRDTTSRYMKVAKGANLRNEGPDEEEEGTSYSFESTPYAGGRIEADGTGLTVRKFVTDHLGSVRAIVTNNTVVERSDYYPFGGKHNDSTLPTLTSNRYGFIGKERQNLFSSTDPYLDFGARFYDPLTARWLSPDPMADKYTSLTQYNYCGADPMSFVDPIGMDVVIEGSEEFKKRYNSVREWLRQNDCDQLLVAIEKDNSVKVTIIESNYSSNVGKRLATNNHLTTAILHWNPNNYLLNEDESKMMSPAVILMHEMKHLSDMIKDYSSFQEDNTENKKGINKAEDRAILFESFIAGELGEIPKGSITRYSYGAVFYSNRIPEGLSARNQSIFTYRYYNRLPKLKHQAGLNGLLIDETRLR